MNKRVALIVMSSLLLSGCSVSTSEVDTSNLKYSLELIEPDSMTLNYENRLSIQGGTQSNEEDSVITPEETAVYGEVNLTGTPIVLYETTDNGSVVYNGTTFDGLETKVASLNKPCSNEALITFIIDSVTSANGTVYVYVDGNTNENSGDDTTIPLGTNLEGSEPYDSLVKEHGEDIQWLLTLNGDNVSYIYGCSSYMIYWGSNQTQSVDYGGEDYVPSTEASTEDTTTEDSGTSSEGTETNVDEEESFEDAYDDSDENSESSEEESSTTDSSEEESTDSGEDDGLEEDRISSDE